MREPAISTKESARSLPKFSPWIVTVSPGELTGGAMERICGFFLELRLAKLENANSLFQRSSADAHISS